MAHQRWLLGAALTALAAGAGLAGCAADTGAGDGGDGSGDGFDDGGDGSGDGTGGMCFSSNECPTGQVCNEFNRCEAPPPPADPDAGPPPPPPEVERVLGHPSSALRYLYVAMPELDALAKIDGKTLAVTAVEVGDRPGEVVSLPGRDDVLVLDRGSATATLVRPTVDNDDKIVLPTLPDVNSVVVDPTGKFAVAWFDLQKAIVEAGSLANVGEIGSFQDVTVLSLGHGVERAADLAVGFRPRAVEFDAAGTRAYVITDDGVSVIELADAAAGTLHVAAAIPVARPEADPLHLEVHITPDGAWALSREDGRPALRVTRVDAGKLGAVSHEVPLPAEITDLDLAADGQVAWAVLREASIFAIIDLPGDVIDPAGVELIDLGGLRVGSAVVDENAGRALLFTNAFYEEQLVVVDLADPAHAIAAWPLEKGVRTVGLAPGGEVALVLHTRLPGNPLETGSVDELVDRSEGYSLVHLDSGFAKLVLTPVAPGSFAFAPSGERAYLALDGGDAEGAVARLQNIDLVTFVADELTLGSPPETVGILPDAGVAFVSQRHALGRVTFVDFVTGAARTVTGFELASHVVD